MPKPRQHLTQVQGHAELGDGQNIILPLSYSAGVVTFLIFVVRSFGSTQNR